MTATTPKNTEMCQEDEDIMQQKLEMPTRLCIS